VLALLVAAACGGGPGLVAPAAPFVPTPERVAAEMLRLAGVTSADVVYDLGSGDGRLPILAAREFGARAVGVEIDPALVQASRERALEAGVADRVTILWQDVLATELRPATVVTLYLSEALNLRLRPRLLRELPPGARIVSHRFGMADWAPERAIDAPWAGGTHRLLLWVVPAPVGGRWTASAGGRPATLDVTQRFSELRATLTLDGADVTLEGTIDGARLVLAGSGYRLTSHVVDRTASGTLVLPDGTPAAWRAERAAP
jgi:hypothetical protein